MPCQLSLGDTSDKQIDSSGCNTGLALTIQQEALEHLLEGVIAVTVSGRVTGEIVYSETPKKTEAGAGACIYNITDQASDTGLLINSDERCKTVVLNVGELAMYRLKELRLDLERDQIGVSLGSLEKIEPTVGVPLEDITNYPSTSSGIIIGIVVLLAAALIMLLVGYLLFRKNM